MKGIARAVQGLAVLALFVLAAGCATQRVDIPAMQPDAAPGEEFENSGYTCYVLFDLVTVHRAEVEKLIAAVNPQNLPVQSLEVDSSEDILATLVNILNGGVIDRGVVFSLNRLSVKGRFAAGSR